MSRRLKSNRPLSKSERSDLTAQGNLLAAGFEEAGRRLTTALKVGLNEASIIVEGKAVLLAPVDTGLLRKSIAHRVVDSTTGFVGQVGTAVEYAGFVEFGTSNPNYPRQEFLHPALNSSRAAINEVISRRLKEEL